MFYMPPNHTQSYSTIMDMLINFPGLVPQNPQLTVYDGYLKVMDQEYRLTMILKSPNTVKDASIKCDVKLRQILKRYHRIIKQRQSQCSSLSSFLQELQNIVERHLETHKQWKKDFTSQNCGHLISEIESLGWNRLISVDANFQTLHFGCLDLKDRQHVLKVKLHPQHPQQAPLCTVDLPAKIDIHWTSSSCLKDVYSQFEQAIDLYQDFWDMMAEIDTKTWVLEPDNPTFGATERRIAVNTTASLQISVDPRRPTMLPECRFMGADQVVQPLREAMNTNLNFWNEQDSLLRNLERLLGVSFPSPSNTKKEEFSVECGICYAYRLDEEIPDNACNDTRCGQPFHQSCLYEWLRALPSTRQSFNTIFGECPYCSKPITVKMPIKR